jgi:hypothetical protein
VAPLAVTITTGTAISATSGSVTIAPLSATVIAATRITATTGAVVLAPHDPTISVGTSTFQAAWAAAVNTILGA